MMRGAWFILREFAVACWEVVKLPFWLIGLGVRRLLALGARKLAMLAVAAVVVTIVFLGLMVEATSQPGFCVSCHFMRPYFDSWKTSTHKDTPCITCHIPPGLEGTIRAKFLALSMVANYMTGVYKRTKPWAEIDDSACLREGCHESRLLASTEDFMGVRFDHKPHLSQLRRDRQLRCTSCHGQIVQGAHITVTEGTCFLCHFKPAKDGKPTDLARCEHCHSLMSDDSAAAFNHASVMQGGVSCTSCHTSTVSGDGFVPRERCNTCHAQVEHIQRYGDLDFVHQQHVTERKVECLQCHIAIRHGREVEAESDPAQQCATCHGGKDNAIAAVWKGELPGLPPTPSSMARTGMSCPACHVEPIHRGGGHYETPVCTPCHDKSFDALWPKWKQPLREGLSAIETRARTLEKGAREQLLRAISVYREGNPVHNPELLGVLSARVGVEARPDLGECATCHMSTEGGVVPWSNKPMPHLTHQRERLECEQCHVTDWPQHGQLKMGREECNACHHRGVTSSACAACHAVQDSVYRGLVGAGVGGDASMMAAAEVSCSDCHAVKGNSVARASAAACIACHDDTYADTLRLWQAEGDSLLVETDRMMKRRDARDLNLLLRRDGSRIVHHPELFRDWRNRIEAVP